jgi:hypothetical protein
VPHAGEHRSERRHVLGRNLPRKPCRNALSELRERPAIPHAAIGDVFDLGRTLERRASARVRGGCVVTEEKLKPKAAKIPNVCEHFGVHCTNVEGFLKQKGWTF